MPDTDLRIRLVTPKEAFDDLSRNPCPFLLINIERHPRGIPMPNQRLLERLREDCDDDLLIVPTKAAELDAVLPLCRDRDRFIAGEFVLMEVTKLHETPERPHGGQDVAGLEERARDGLYVTVTMVTERLRACDDRQEGRKMATETRRGEIFETLQPLLRNLSARNCFDAGQRRVEAWYPGLTAHQAMKSVYAGVLEGLRNGAKRAFVKEEQLELVRTSYAVYAKAEQLLKAQHAMSAELRKVMESGEFVKANAQEQHEMQAKFLRERATAQHQELAHNKEGGPSLPQLMLAAAAMDLNPSSIYANVIFYKSELDCAMLLGRVERGVGVMFEPKHIKRLKRFMSLADASDGVDAETEAARALRDLALRVRARAPWEEFFTVAEADGREFWINKAL
ncbi:hypothetical protein [Bradyrhizobium sp. 164]|uniref:hypothetical protein n=1 Tax=Bradyrhizobium sp. 164 TaxID=2782637 RepID=UPI001FF929FD|nr:hypothetical protein [Bradyrhizobium sp. 164]MCK1597952.1 hypothetical protein [Bradyrhizobium sp. 164]